MVNEGDKYSAICFKDPSIRNWFKTDCTRLSKLGLEAFMKKLRATFLASNWQEEMEREGRGERRRTRMGRVKREGAAGCGRAVLLKS